MNLRTLMVQRILFAITEEELLAKYAIDADADPDFDSLSDLDLFELYESLCVPDWYVRADYAGSV